MRRWSKIFLEWYGKPLPLDYLVFDLETTGLKRDWHLPVDIGHTIVRNKKVVHQGNFLLNWTGYPGVERERLVADLNKVAAAMQAQGKPHHYPIERLEAEGKDPFEVLVFYYQLFTKNRRAGAKFVGHNALFFDAVMFSHIVEEATELVWEFKPNEVFDTGVMFKITQGGLAPRPDEKSLKEYFLRAKNAYMKGVKWNIESCVKQYHLAERFGLGELHGAAADSYVSHLLFEELRHDYELQDNS